MVGMTLEQMKNVDIRTVDRRDLVNIRDIKNCTELPKRDCIIDYIRQAKNPYCVLVGETIVKLCFEENGDKLQDVIMGIFRKT